MKPEQLEKLMSEAAKQDDCNLLNLSSQDCSECDLIIKSRQLLPLLLDLWKAAGPINLQAYFGGISYRQSLESREFARCIDALEKYEPV